MKRVVISLILLFVTFSATAEKNCTGKFANPVTDVCWSCLFPITIGKVAVAKGKNPDTKNPSWPICKCKIPLPPYYRVGLSIGFWEPISLVDVTYKPFCMVNLGGAQLGMSKNYSMGTQNARQGDSNKSFYHVHWYKFPLMLWLNILTSAACMQAGEFDVAYLTEIDPTWNSNLASILNPEAILFANPIAQASCSADALMTSTGNSPINALFWCAGAQGSMYPLSGHVQEQASGVQASTLLSERMAYKMHRELLLFDSYSTSSAPSCHEVPRPIIPKDRYRYQMTYPYATTSRTVGCKPFGASTVIWESGKEFPVKGEDFGYLIWRKRNCCAL